MTSIAQERFLSKEFTIRAPQTNAPDAPCWLCHCIIDYVDDRMLRVFFVCQDWLSASFDLPLPKDLDNVYHCIYLSVCEIVAQERIEYLCTL